MTTETNEKNKKRVEPAAALSRVGRDSDQFIVRLPEGMRQYLGEIAERQGRSMNAVAVTALALYFAHEGTAVADQFERTPYLLDLLKAVKDLTAEVAYLRKSKR